MITINTTLSQTIDAYVSGELLLSQYRMAVYIAGSSLKNVGTITATATTDNTIQAQISAGDGSSQQLIYYTPADTQALSDF